MQKSIGFCVPGHESPQSVLYIFLSQKQNEFWPSEVCPSTDMPYTHGILFTTLLEKNPYKYLLSPDVLDHEMNINHKKQNSIFCLYKYLCLTITF